MRSRASVNGHPIHGALIPFPFAFLTGALLFDLLGWLTGQSSWQITGGHLAGAGILAALVAAVPGAIDYFYTVPPRSSGKKRATQHMLLNLAAVALMALAWFMRRPDAASPVVLAVELVSVGLLSYGSFHGGVLVTRNQISVDHRYASAGKWKEVTLTAVPGQPLDVAASDELEPNQMKLVRVDDQRIVLARTDNSYVAFDDRCTHRGGSLAGGVMACGTVHCPWHGSQFDAHSGRVTAGPANENITSYAVEEKAGRVRLLI